MTFSDVPDQRIARRRNTVLVPYRKHGNTARLLLECLSPRVQIYFYPRVGPLDRAFFAIRKRLSLKTKLVTHVLTTINDYTASPGLSRSIREADAVVAISSHVAETVQGRFGIQAGVIYDGVDRRFYYPRPKESHVSPHCLTVLYAGSFQRTKRVELVIRQAARLPEVEFRLAGAGPTMTACRTLAAQLGCANVEFLGHLPSAQLGEEMRHADVFLFPSILEGHPQVLGQAMACGLPAIAMSLYRPEYIVDGVTGLLANSDEEIAAKLDQLLGNGDLRRSFAEAATKHAARFDWDRAAEQWQQIFEEVVRGCEAKL